LLELEDGGFGGFAEACGVVDVNRVASVADFGMVIMPVELALREERRRRIGGCCIYIWIRVLQGKSGDFFGRSMT
jgi:hypothetical protein